MERLLVVIVEVIQRRGLVVFGVFPVDTIDHQATAEDFARRGLSRHLVLGGERRRRRV